MPDVWHLLEHNGACTFFRALAMTYYVAPRKARIEVMGRPTCFECGKQLMYVHGKPVFEEWTDPIGNAHRLHKECAKRGGYKTKPVTAAPVGEMLPMNSSAYSRAKIKD